MADSAPAVLILVDDDAAVLGALKFVFEVEGCEVRAFADAESLLAEPDLPEAGCLILDYWLPGLNGLDLLASLRGRGLDLPAVLISTATPQMRLKADAAGVPLIEKPLQTETLLDTVMSLLRRQGLRP